MANDLCDWKGCRQLADIGYLNRKEMCYKHFVQFCDWQDKGKEDEARAKIGLKPKKKKPSTEKTEKNISPSEQKEQEPND